jgi:hypothetical protein
MTTENPVSVVRRFARNDLVTHCRMIGVFKVISYVNNLQLSNVWITDNQTPMMITFDIPENDLTLFQNYCIL